MAHRSTPLCGPNSNSTVLSGFEIASTTTSSIEYCSVRSSVPLPSSIFLPTEAEVYTHVNAQCSMCPHTDSPAQPEGIAFRELVARNVHNQRATAITSARRQSPLHTLQHEEQFRTLPTHEFGIWKAKHIKSTARFCFRTERNILPVVS